LYATFQKIFRARLCFIVDGVASSPDLSTWGLTSSVVESVIQCRAGHEDDLLLKLLRLAQERSSKEARRVPAVDVLLKLLKDHTTSAAVAAAAAAAVSSQTSPPPPLQWKPSQDVQNKILALSLHQANKIIIQFAEHTYRPPDCEDLLRVCQYIGYTCADVCSSLPAAAAAVPTSATFSPSISSPLDPAQRQERSRLLAKLLQYLSKASNEHLVSLISSLQTKQKRVSHTVQCTEEMAVLPALVLTLHSHYLYTKRTMPLEPTQPRRRILPTTIKSGNTAVDIFYASLAPSSDQISRHCFTGIPAARKEAMVLTANLRALGVSEVGY
jgi:hypothetical protein